jgi:hypothetical protein
MAYYPKSRIITGKKANPGQFATSDGKPYSGTYYTTFDGNIFTGNDPTDPNSRQLLTVPKFENLNPNISYSKDSINYRILNPFTFPNLINPVPFTPSPTEEDYKIGKITRYLARQRTGTTFKIMEIDQATYDAFINVNTAETYALWKPIAIFWQISGPLRNERINNVTTRAGIVDTNQRVLDNAEKNFIGIKQYLTNLTQFSKPS